MDSKFYHQTEKDVTLKILDDMEPQQETHSLPHIFPEYICLMCAGLSLG